MPSATSKSGELREVWKAIVPAYNNAAAASAEVPFNLAAVAAIPGCPSGLHDHVRDFDGRENIPEAIARVIRGKVDALVLDHTRCDLTEEWHESASMHAKLGERSQLLDIARLDAGATFDDRASTVIDRVLALSRMGLLLPESVPVLGVQQSVAVAPIRRKLAIANRAYAMRIDPGTTFFRIALHLDAYDDGPGEYDVESAFILESEVPGRKDVQVIPMRHLLRSLEERVQIPEYLVRLITDEGASFYVARPASGRAAHPDESYHDEAVALSRHCQVLPKAPLANKYAADRFHHRNYRPWENMVLNAALYEAELLEGCQDCVDAACLDDTPSEPRDHGRST